MTPEQFLDSIQHIVQVPPERREQVIEVIDMIVRRHEGTA